MGIKVGRAYMVMAIFTRAIHHLQTASSLIPHRTESEKGAGPLQNKLRLPLLHPIALSLPLFLLWLLGESIVMKVMKCNLVKSSQLSHILGYRKDHVLYTVLTESECGADNTTAG